MTEALLVAGLGVIGTLGAALILRVGQVKTLVNGKIDKLLQMVEDRDARIRELMEAAGINE